MEVAIGEYDIDLTKMMGTALKKYYEERDAHALGLMAADNVIRHHGDGKINSNLLCFRMTTTIHTRTWNIDDG